MSVVKPNVLKKGGKQRVGRGFSLDELKAAKITPKKALKFKVPIDARRRTVHEENVKALKNFIESKSIEAKKAAEPVKASETVGALELGSKRRKAKSGKAQ